MSQAITCPACNRQYSPKPELAGKRVKCKCGERITFPAPRYDPLDEILGSAPAPAPRPQPTAVDLMEYDDNPYRMAGESVEEAPVQAPPIIAPPLEDSVSFCFRCRAPLAPAAVLCTRCGFNQRTRSQMSTQVERAPVATIQPKPNPRRASAGSGDASANILFGLILLGIGIAITIGTYSAAANGGTYIIATGPMVWGGIKIIRGLIQAATG